MFKWLFHSLFNPHCQQCRAEIEADLICNDCEYLKQQISLLQQERDKLLSQILDKPAESIEQSENPQPLNTSRFIPFSVKRQELEHASRIEAAAIANKIKNDHKENIESLEKEILSAKVEPVDLSGVEDVK